MILIIILYSQHLHSGNDITERINAEQNAKNDKRPGGSKFSAETGINRAYPWRSKL